MSKFYKMTLAAALAALLAGCAATTPVVDTITPPPARELDAKTTLENSQ